MSWWVGAQHPTTGVHLVVSEPYRKVSASWSSPVTVGDCEIVPVAAYEVAGVNVDTEFESDGLQVSTIDAPDNGIKYWADCVGTLDNYCTGNWVDCDGDGDCPAGESCIEQWSPPDGVVSFMDVSAAVFAFAQVPGLTVTKVEDLDLHGNDAGNASIDPPNYLVNFTDIGNIIKAFEGYPYPYNDPGDCPDVEVCP